MGGDAALEREAAHVRGVCARCRVDQRAELSRQTQPDGIERGTQELQSRPADRRLRRKRRQPVERRKLVEPDRAEETVGCHCLQKLRTRREQRFFQLIADALHGKRGGQGCAGGNGGGGLRRGREAELGAEAVGAEHPQRILAKASFRVADAAENAGPKILLPAKKICDAPGQIHRHGIDGEIAAGEILLEPRNKAHLRRVASVKIRALRAKRRDLGLRAVQKHGDGPVADAGRDAV